jgi:hypothetical protein
MVNLYKMTAACVGANGSAAGTVTTEFPIIGTIRAIHIDHSASGAATTDVVIATVNTPSIAILTVTDNATDGWYHPSVMLHDNAAAAVTYDGTNEIYVPVSVVDAIKVTVAQANSAQTVTVTIIYER